MNTRSSIHTSIGLGLGLGLCTMLALVPACAVEDGEGAVFRGESYGGSTGKDDHGDTDKTTGDEGDTGKTTGDVGETGDEKKECPRTQGYWKTHNIYGPADFEPWPAIPGETLPTENSTFFNCTASWYQVLWAPPRRGNAFLILAHQYIAAVLNEASGVEVPTNVAQAISDAEDLLSGPCGQVSDREEAIEVAGILDDFNNGEFSEGCEEDEEDGDGGDGYE